MTAYRRPTRLSEALALLAEASVPPLLLAGGTDIYPARAAAEAWMRPVDRPLLDLSALPDLAGIEDRGDHHRIGALVTWAALRDAALPPWFYALRQAAAQVGGAQVQNRGTLVGNLCNASPAADGVPPLLALDAELELASLAKDGTVSMRRVPIDGFFTGPGRTRRAPNELLTAIRVPLGASGRVTRFYKAGTRPALDISTVVIALASGRDGEGRLHGVRLALGAVAPTPLRARRAEALLEGKVLDEALADAAARAAADEAKPIDDVRASAWYRKELLHNMTRRMLTDVVQN
jgi:CO/xanthine dehydrogenase FAD-binding subunit